MTQGIRSLYNYIEVSADYLKTAITYERNIRGVPPPIPLPNGNTILKMFDQTSGQKLLAVLSREELDELITLSRLKKNSQNKSNGEETK